MGNIFIAVGILMFVVFLFVWSKKVIKGETLSFDSNSGTHKIQPSFIIEMGSNSPSENEIKGIADMIINFEDLVKGTYVFPEKFKANYDHITEQIKPAMPSKENIVLEKYLKEIEDFYFVRVDSSNQALGRNYPYYNLTGAECEAQDTGKFRLIRSPIASYYVSNTGVVAPGSAVQFIDQSEYATTLTWDFGDQTGTFIDPIQWHYYNQIGSFDLYQFVSDQYGCSDDNLDVNLITVSDWTGVDETSFTYSVYPNPTFGLLKIVTDLTVIENEIYDLGGKLIFKTTKNEIDLSELPLGTYILRTTSEDRLLTNKITLLR